MGAEYFFQTALGSEQDNTVNLKELSSLLELSPTTVSRALNGYPEVSEDTRQRVLRAVKETGYRPNRAAQRLATGVAGSIGLVMPTGSGHDTDLHFAEFMSGLCEVALENDLHLVVTPSRPEDEEATFQRLAASRTVDALFAAYIRSEDPRIPLLKKLNIPFVVHGREIDAPNNHPFLDIDNAAAFSDATKLLLQLGHKRFALLNGPDYLAFAILRCKGMRDELAGAGISIDESRIQHSHMTEEFGFRGMQNFLDQPDPPTAVLCSSMILALGAVRAINQRGLVIGRDISLIAHDDVFPFVKPENFSTPLTTTRSSLREAGARVATRLTSAVRGKIVHPEQELWKADLIVRASTGPAPN